MKRLFLCIVAAALSLAAQPTGNQPAERLFILKYADPSAVASLLRVFDVFVAPNPELHALAIKAGEGKWPGIEDAIRRLDTPAAVPKNVDFSVYFLLAGKEGQQGMPVSAEVEPVVAQLKKAFAFAEYRVLDTLMLRTRVGQMAEASGSLAGGRARPQTAEVKTGTGPKTGQTSVLVGRAAPIVTQVKMRAASVDPEGRIHIDRLSAGMRIPTVVDNKGSFNYIDTGINTNIDVMDGQKVVVGKSSFEGPDKAVFLVLTAKVLE